AAAGACRAHAGSPVGTAGDGSRITGLRERSARRAPYTRSGRTPTTEATARAVMIASPSPMTRCHETIASTTLSVDTGAVPPTANSRENTIAAAGTLTKAATAAAGGTTPS